MKKYIFYCVLMLAFMFSATQTKAEDYLIKDSQAAAAYAENPIDEGITVGTDIKAVYAKEKKLPISVKSITALSSIEIQSTLSPHERELVKDYEDVNIYLLRYEWSGSVYLVTDTERKIVVSIRVVPKDTAYYKAKE